jgi:hypothetical protein
VRRGVDNDDLPGDARRYPPPVRNLANELDERDLRLPSMYRRRIAAEDDSDVVARQQPPKRPDERSAPERQPVPDRVNELVIPAALDDKHLAMHWQPHAASSDEMVEQPEHELDH